jgi:hypothetical protein
VTADLARVGATCCSEAKAAQDSVVAKSDHITLAHWQHTQARSTSEFGMTSVRFSCGLIKIQGALEDGAI